MLLIRIHNILTVVLFCIFSKQFGCELTWAMGRDFQEDGVHWASIYAAITREKAKSATMLLVGFPRFYYQRASA